jgi:hypothetical protein
MIDSIGAIDFMIGKILTQTQSDKSIEKPIEWNQSYSDASHFWSRTLILL